MTPFSEYLNIFLIFLPLVFALQLLTYKNAYSRPNRILGIYMILLASYYALNKVVVFEITSITYLNAILVLPIFLSFNPFYYLYVKSLTSEDFKFRTKDMLHFLPALLFCIFLIAISIISNSGNNEQLSETLYGIRVPIAVSLYYIQVISYTSLMIFLLKGHQKNLDQFFSYKENISLNWLWLFIIIYLLFTSFDALVFFTNIFDAYYKLTYWVLMLLFVVFLGYFGTKQSDIYVGKMKTRKAEEDALEDAISEKAFSEETDDMVHEEKNLKYGKSSLSEEQKEMILQTVTDLMEQEQLYKNAQLVVDQIADKIHTNKKYISQVINEKLNKNFYQFVNEYRVKYVIDLLQDTSYNNYTIEAIGDMAGFNSRSSLISAFKKITGKTPSDYKKNH